MFYRITCHHTSPQNDMVKPSFKHLVDVGLVMLIKSHVSLKFWPYVFKIVVYTLNRVPTKVLNFSSPYSKLFHREPDYSLLRVFGSLYFPCLRPLTKINFNLSPLFVVF